MSCVYTIEKCQAAGEKKPYGFNWTLLLANTWIPNTPYATGAKVRPSTEEKQTGFEYSSSGGQSSGKREPVWPTALGGTVVDGSITWTAAALSNDSLLERISTSTWTVDTDLTDSGDASVDSPGQQATSVYITGGTPDTTYLVLNEIVTTDGAEYPAIIELTIAEAL
jgi:hypothetical protein